MKKVLFIDRDGTLVKEPNDEQIDALEKVIFYPTCLTYLSKIAEALDFELVLVTNQDGLGTSSFPEETFWPAHNFIMKTFANEGVIFANECIDKSFPQENKNTRKPGIGMLTEYLSGNYNLAESYVIGDRLTDIELAKNLGCKGIFINDETHLGTSEITVAKKELEPYIALDTNSWKRIYEFLKGGARVATISRKTNETNINISLNLDGTGNSNIATGIAFFDHMLDQLAKHGQIDLEITVKGDLEVDEHHTIEDTAIALGEAFYQAIGNKLGMERYGFCLFLTS